MAARDLDGLCLCVMPTNRKSSSTSFMLSSPPQAASICSNHAAFSPPHMAGHSGVTSTIPIDLGVIPDLIYQESYGHNEHDVSGIRTSIGLRIKQVY